ncbi:MAG: response regulator [Bauldia sp.]|nr:response regulator [Bauldia sp.]
MTSAHILVVDDAADNRAILRDRLESQGYRVTTANDGEEAIARVKAEPPDLILLDVMMPKLDGISALRRLKADPDLPFIPVILLTARSDTADVVGGLDAGADEYLAKPIDHLSLVARVKAMLRLKRLQDRLLVQAAELAAWNRELESRVAAQVGEIERMSRLKRFLAPEVSAAILSSPSGEAALLPARADVAVLFCDLRDFTAFAELAEPEDVVRLLADYHAAAGEQVFEHGGTLERFAGDGMMVIFNAPVPCEDFCRKAVALALALRAGVGAVLERWKSRGAGLGLGIGVAAGYATVGPVGFARRFDYAAIGNVTNIASRLCALAEPGQILISQRVAQEIGPAWRTNPLGEVGLKGFSRPAIVYELAG